MTAEIYLLASAGAAFTLGWWIGRAILCRSYNRQIEGMAIEHREQLTSLSIRAKREGVQAEQQAEAVRKRSQLHNAT